MNPNYHTTYFLSQPRMPAPSAPRTRGRRNASLLTRARKAFAAR